MPLATLVTVTGSLYDCLGVKLLAGRLTITPSRFIVNGTNLVSRNPIIVDIPGSGNLSFTLAPNGPATYYTVVFDPDVADVVTPLKLKSGYFSRAWIIPAVGPVTIASL